jgi:hypothetical protein
MIVKALVLVEAGTPEFSSNKVATLQFLLWLISATESRDQKARNGIPSQALAMT